MQRNQRDTLLGVMFFGTLGFLLWATVNLTDLSLASATPLNVWFPDAGGIRVGDPVLVLGKRIGKVMDVQFHRERPRHRIEVPVFPWNDRWILRVSAQVYNRPEDYERLAAAVKAWL